MLKDIVLYVSTILRSMNMFKNYVVAWMGMYA